MACTSPGLTPNALGGYSSSVDSSIAAVSSKSKMKSIRAIPAAGSDLAVSISCQGDFLEVGLGPQDVELHFLKACHGVASTVRIIQFSALSRAACPTLFFP